MNFSATAQRQSSSSLFKKSHSNDKTYAENVALEVIHPVLSPVQFCTVSNWILCHWCKIRNKLSPTLLQKLTSDIVRRCFLTTHVLALLHHILVEVGSLTQDRLFIHSFCSPPQTIASSWTRSLTSFDKKCFHSEQTPYHQQAPL